MKVFFITGTSGSGKSTLLHELKKLIPEKQYAIHDFDEVGVPENADLNWRIETTKHWINTAIENLKNSKTTVICGQVVPSEVASILKNHPLEAHFAFIQIPPAVIEQRLRNRGWPEKLIEDNINWAQVLEKEVRTHPKHLVIDGSCAPEHLAKEVAAWIGYLIG